MTEKRYSVEHWYSDARDWAEYFETDSLAAAHNALQTGDPPDMHPNDYDYTMRHYRRRNKRRLYDIQEERVIQECEPDLRYTVGYKLLIWGLPLGLILMLALSVIKNCGK